jgi:type I restriction enzyme, R subunit
VDLKYYRLQQISQGDIVLTVADSAPVKGPTDTGTRTAKAEKAPLSEIIEILNERFGTEFKKADQLFFEQLDEEAKADDAVVQWVMANSFENFALAFRQVFLNKMLDRMDQNGDIVSQYMNEPEFQEATFTLMARRVYEGVRAGMAASR